jgi:hypothetical protein
MLYFAYYLMFSLEQNWRRGRNSFCLEEGCARTVHTDVSKCNNDKIKERRNKILAEVK